GSVLVYVLDRPAYSSISIDYGCRNKYKLDRMPPARCTRWVGGLSAGMDRVHIFDTTLRDGEQAPGFSMNTGEKLRLARQLEDLGVDVIEAGFPIASKGDFEAVRAVAREIRGSTVAGLARAR